MTKDIPLLYIAEASQRKAKYRAIPKFIYLTLNIAKMFFLYWSIDTVQSQAVAQYSSSQHVNAKDLPLPKQLGKEKVKIAGLTVTWFQDLPLSFHSEGSAGFIGYAIRSREWNQEFRNKATHVWRINFHKSV